MTNRNEYVKRYLEDAVVQTHKNFKVVYVGGPRQVGKTTMLQELARTRGVSYVSLDDLKTRQLAQQDPPLFLQSLSMPVFIDEVQYAPDLFSYMKMHVDASRRNGQFWLSGSQHFSLMKGLQESLAGRVGVLSLSGFSWAEEHGLPVHKHAFTPESVQQTSSVRLSASQVFDRIFRGTFPILATNPDMPREQFFSSYVQTYLDRDVRDIFGVEKMAAFQTFLGLVAARTGQMLNVSAIARDAGISVNAARSWIHILQASGIVFLLQPYFANISKRLVKAPKLYMLDTGLAAYLMRWPDRESLQHGAMAGALFETYVVSEVYKSFINRGLEPSLYYLRSQDGHEVDLLIGEHRNLYPVEIKMTATPGTQDIADILFFRERISSLGKGAVVCLAQDPLPITRTIDRLPVTAIV